MGVQIRKKLKDGTEAVSALTLGCATVIYSVAAPEEGGQTLFAHGINPRTPHNPPV